MRSVMNNPIVTFHLYCEILMAVNFNILMVLCNWQVSRASATHLQNLTISVPITDTQDVEVVIKKQADYDPSFLNYFLQRKLSIAIPGLILK